MIIGNMCSQNKLASALATAQNSP